jgi:hypothetical protein
MEAHARFDLPTRTRVVLAMAALVVVAVIGVSIVPMRYRVGESATPTPAPGLTLEPIASPGSMVFPRSGELPIGTYGAIVDGASFTFKMPLNGWTSSQTAKGQLDATNLTAGGDRLGDVSLRFWAPDNVYADPCVRTPMVPPVGHSASDLAAAMTKIPGVVVLRTEDISVGGVPAKSVWLTIDDAIPCPAESFYLWYDRGDVPDAVPRRPAAANSTIMVWIVDVGGARIVVDSDVFMLEREKLAYGEQVTAIRQIADSIRFTPIPPDVLHYVDRVLTTCTTTSDRFASDPAVVGGFRSYAPEFAAVDDAAAHAEAVVRITGAALQELRALPGPTEILETANALYDLFGSSLAPLRQVSEAARTPNAERVASLLTEAYDRQANGSLATGLDPLHVELLATSVDRCRFPSGGG